MYASNFHPGYSSLPSVIDEGDFAEHCCICKSRIFERNQHFLEDYNFCEHFFSLFLFSTHYSVFLNK